jgi:hypothetical protein
MRALQLVSAAVLLLTSGVASAGLTLTYDRKNASGESGTAVMMFEPGRIRMDGMGGGGPRGGGRTSSVIFDGGAKKITIIDQDKKTYHELTEADAKAMKERMDGMKAQMAERMKTLPPEQRKQAEEMMNRMGGGGSGAIEIKYDSLGKKKKVAGFDCEMYKVTIGTFSSSEACIAPWSSNLVTKAEAEQFRKSFADLEKMFAGLSAMRSNDWSKAPGIPVEQTHMGQDGKPDSTMTLKSVNRGSIAASQFQVPAGFTKQEMPMGGRGMGPGGPHGGPGGPHGGPGGPHGPHGGGQ